MFNKQAQQEVRVFGYEMARELSEAELEMVGGAGTSYSSNGNACVADDCAA